MLLENTKHIFIDWLREKYQLHRYNVEIYFRNEKEVTKFALYIEFFESIGYDVKHFLVWVENEKEPFYGTTIDSPFKVLKPSFSKTFTDRETALEDGIKQADIFYLSFGNLQEQWQKKQENKN